jgi:hypothetical protein
MGFLGACCEADDDGKATVTDPWSAFCDYADCGGMFGDLLLGAFTSVFPVDARRVRGPEGYAFVGVRLRDLAECSMAA